jgi:hypothetical protein
MAFPALVQSIRDEPCSDTLQSSTSCARFFLLPRCQNFGRRSRISAVLVDAAYFLSERQEHSSSHHGLLRSLSFELSANFQHRRIYGSGKLSRQSLLHIYLMAMPCGNDSFPDSGNSCKLVQPTRTDWNIAVVSYTPKMSFLSKMINAGNSVVFQDITLDIRRKLLPLQFREGTLQMKKGTKSTEQSFREISRI